MKLFKLILKDSVIFVVALILLFFSAQRYYTLYTHYRKAVPVSIDEIANKSIRDGSHISISGILDENQKPELNIFGPTDNPVYKIKVYYIKESQDSKTSVKIEEKVPASTTKLNLPQQIHINGYYVEDGKDVSVKTDYDIGFGLTFIAIVVNLFAFGIIVFGIIEMRNDLQKYKGKKSKSKSKRKKKSSAKSKSKTKRKK